MGFISHKVHAWETEPSAVGEPPRRPFPRFFCTHPTTHPMTHPHLILGGEHPLRADARDDAPDRQAGAGDDEAGRDAHQHGPRAARRRKGAGAASPKQPQLLGGSGRVRGRAAHGPWPRRVRKRGAFAAHRLCHAVDALGHGVCGRGRRTYLWTREGGYLCGQHGDEVGLLHNDTVPVVALQNCSWTLHTALHALAPRPRTTRQRGLPAAWSAC